MRAVFGPAAGAHTGRAIKCIVEGPMDECIEAIEGTARSVLRSLYDVFVEDRQDDTEYIRNVKAVMEALQRFSRENGQALSDPESSKSRLYRFSKELWLENLKRDTGDGPEAEPEPVSDDTDYEDYYDYYFDYIYNHGVYPR
jgi:hypothetical protein